MSKPEITTERQISPIALRLLWQMTTKDGSTEEAGRCQKAWDDLEANLAIVKPILQSYNIWQHIQVLHKGLLSTGVLVAEKTFIAYLRGDFDYLYGEYKSMDDEDQQPHSVEALCIMAVEEDRRYQLKQALGSAGTNLAEQGVEAAWTGLHQYLINTPPGDNVVCADFADPAVWSDIANTLDNTISQNEAGTLNIKTGIAAIDHHNTFYQRKELVGILGMAGGYKSTFARTLAYNAALQGHKILYFPLETRIENELQTFIVQHVLRNRPNSILNRIDCRNGTIQRGSLAYKDFMWGIEDLKRLQADGSITMPTFVDFAERSNWGAIRKEIYRRVRQEQVDIVVIDYLTLISKDGAKDPRVYMEDVIIDLAKFTKSENIAIITPIQAGRDKKRVMDTRILDTDSIYNYSELEKSFDLIYSVYQGPYNDTEHYEDAKGNEKTRNCVSEMGKNELCVGTAKTRAVPPIETAIELAIMHNTYIASESVYDVQIKAETEEAKSGQDDL